MLVIFVVGRFLRSSSSSSAMTWEKALLSVKTVKVLLMEKKEGKREENCEHGVRGIFRKALQDLSVETVEGLFVERTRQEDEENGKMVRGKRYLQALLPCKIADQIR